MKNNIAELTIVLLAAVMASFTAYARTNPDVPVEIRVHNREVASALRDLAHNDPQRAVQETGRLLLRTRPPAVQPAAYFAPILEIAEQLAWQANDNTIDLEVLESVVTGALPNLIDEHQVNGRQVARILWIIRFTQENLAEKAELVRSHILGDYGWELQLLSVEGARNTPSPIMLDLLKSEIDKVRAAQVVREIEIAIQTIDLQLQYFDSPPEYRTRFVREQIDKLLVDMTVEKSDFTPRIIFDLVGLLKTNPAADAVEYLDQLTEGVQYVRALPLKQHDEIQDWSKWVFGEIPIDFWALDVLAKRNELRPDDRRLTGILRWPLEYSDPHNRLTRRVYLPKQ